MASSQHQCDVATGTVLQHGVQNSHIGRLRLEPGQRVGAGRKRSSDPVPAVLQPVLKIERDEGLIL